MKSVVVLMIALAVLGECAAKGRSKHSKKSKKYLFNKVGKAKKGTLNIDPFATNRRQAKRQVINTGVQGEAPEKALFNATFLAEYKRVVSQVLLFRMLRNGLEREDSLLSEKMLTLNQYGLYVHEPKDKTLNGLEDMIRLDQMVTDEDVVQIRNSLPTLSKIVSEVRLVEMTSQTFQGQFPCFSVTDNDQVDTEWQICDYMNTFGDEKLGSRLALFRQAIINKVVMHIQWKNKMRFTIQVALTDQEKFGQKDGFDNWSYEKQDEWGGQCKEGLQSPIDIIDNEVLAITNQIQAHPAYQGDGDAYSFQGTNDRYLIGNFGHLLYLNNLDAEGYFMCPWRIEFKYNAEHLINSAVPDALEILVYHKKNPSKYKGDKDKDGCEAIVSPVIKQYKEINTEQDERDATDSHTDMVLSFLVQPNATLTAEESGVFWQGMAVTNLVSAEKELQKPLSMTPLAANKGVDDGMIANLEGLIDDGLKARFPYSFYYYQGSLSQPGCKTELHRIVMYTKIDVNVDLFNNLKSKVLDGYAQKQNFRRPSNEGTNSMKGFRVLRHIDTSQKQKCPTSEILKAYADPNYKRNLSPSEYLDYEKLIAGLSAQEQKFSSAYEKLNAETNVASLKAPEIKTTVAEFNHMVDINTKIHHVHKVPRKLIKKIFNKDEVGHGVVAKIGKLDGNNFDVTYLGENIQTYTTKVAKPHEVKGVTQEQKERIDVANEVIQKNDMENLNQQEPKPEKVLNQNLLSPLEKEQLAPYLVNKDNKEEEDKNDKKKPTN